MLMIRPIKKKRSCQWDTKIPLKCRKFEFEINTLFKVTRIEKSE
ncbi:hypothetical protein [Filifactor alocis]|nr:hypothetical protein [Filifactor alocis]